MESGERGIDGRVERLEELAMFGEQSSEETRLSIADLLAKVSALAARLAAMEERIGKWSETERAKTAGGSEGDGDGVTG